MIKKNDFQLEIVTSTYRIKTRLHLNHKLK